MTTAIYEGNTIVENGIEYSVVRRLEWDTQIELELYSPLTGESKHITLMK